jgi:hypothetical protein
MSTSGPADVIKVKAEAGGRPELSAKQDSWLTQRDARNPSKTGAGPPPGALLRFPSSERVATDDSDAHFAMAEQQCDETRNADERCCL